MSAVAILAKPSPAPAATGDVRALAPGALNDVSAFANMVAEDAPAEPVPASPPSPQGEPSSNMTPADVAIDTAKKGLLSSGALLAVQQSGAEKAVADATPSNEAVAVAQPSAPVEAKDATPSEAETSVKPATTDDGPSTVTDGTLPAPTPVLPTPVVLAAAATSAPAAAQAPAQAVAQAAGSDGDAPPKDVAPPGPDASLPARDTATAQAPTVAPIPTFEQAVANASVSASKGQSSTNAATTGLDTPPVATPAAPSPAAQTDVASADALPPAPTPPATPPVAPAILAEAAASAPIPTGAPAQTQPAAPAPPPVIVPTNVSHVSQTTLDTTVQIAARITRELKGRSTRFEMGLTPEGLGRVDVSLDIDSGGQLTARLAFDNPLAATELRGKADELRRELTDAGFTIARDGLDFSERQPSSSNGGFDRQQGRAFASASRITNDADLSQPAPAAWMSLSLTRSGVDMKV
ncbi:hypothetical protein BH10PSE1_BH10PSE1_32040 [soil metagenome]